MPYVIPFDSAVFFFNTIDRDRIKGLTPRAKYQKSFGGKKINLAKKVGPYFTCLCIGVPSILTNTNTTFQTLSKISGV
jgi:hypothetical protein